jgi:hypothetical protein
MTSLLAKACEVCGELPAEENRSFCRDCSETMQAEYDAEEARRTPITDEVQP